MDTAAANIDVDADVDENVDVPVSVPELHGELCERSFLDALNYWAKPDVKGDSPLFTFLDDQGKPVPTSSGPSTLTHAAFEKLTARLACRMLLSPEQGGFGLQHQEKVLLVYPPGLDFITAFVACMRAGVVGIPVYPPRPGKNKDLSMFLSVQANCGATVVLTNTAYGWAKRIASIKESITSAFSSSDSSSTTWPDQLRWIVTDDNASLNFKKGDDAAVRSEVGLDQSTEDDLAFFQYTSGSTAAPKGVMLTHGNLKHNLASIILALEASDDTVVVSWLPQYHDMGLIGSQLGALYCGGCGYYLSPVSFIKRPPVWLEAVTKYRGTHLQAPNFAYRLTVRKFLQEQEKGKANSKNKQIELSCVRHIFNAAEPVDGMAIDDFLRTFSQYGLDKSAIVPGYGLAEHTVYVCDKGKQRLLVDKEALEVNEKVVVRSKKLNQSTSQLKPPSEGQEQQQEQQQKQEQTDASATMELVGCGFPSRLVNAGIKVIIVRPDTNEPLLEDNVGEIWVSSPSKSQGYYGLPEKSQSELHAKVDVSKCDPTQWSGPDELEDLQSREWLRTGDLGFLHKKELFVTGRIKDLVIVRGRNHYPQDLEHSIENCDPSAFRPGCSAAFTVKHPDSNTEVLAVAAELRSSMYRSLSQSDVKAQCEELAAKVRRAITSEHAVRPFAVALLEEKSIPKTTSGKISRHRVRIGFLDHTLKEVYRWDGLDQAQGEGGSGSGDADGDAEVINEGEDFEAIADAEQDSKGNQSVDVTNTVTTNAATATATATATASTGANRGENENEKEASIRERLVDEAASLLEVDAQTISTTTPLVEMGFDSMALTQLKGMLANSMGVEIEEETLFSEETTIETLVERVQHPNEQGNNNDKSKSKSKSKSTGGKDQDSAAESPLLSSNSAGGKRGGGGGGGSSPRGPGRMHRGVGKAPPSSQKTYCGGLCTC